MGRPVIVGPKSSHAVVAWPSNRTLLLKILSDDDVGQGTSDIVKTIQGRDLDAAAVLSSDGVKLLAALGQKGLEQAKMVLRAQSDDDNPVLAGIELYVHLLNAISSEVASAAAGLQLEERERAPRESMGLVSTDRKDRSHLARRKTVPGQFAGWGFPTSRTSSRSAESCQRVPWNP